MRLAVLHKMSYANFYRDRLPSIVRQIRKIKRYNTPKYYAVAVGRRVGVYRSWPSCKVQIDGIANAKYKRFEDPDEALKYLSQTRKEVLLIEQESLNEACAVHAAVVYTDGSCWRNGMEDACAGVGVYWPAHPERNICEKIEGKQTSIRAEINAAIMALEKAKEMGIDCLTIYTDSHFVIQTATKWLKKWKSNGWRTSCGGEVKNKEDMIELDQALSGVRTVIWRAVSGHSGVKGNDEADRLANAAIAKYMKSRQRSSDT